MIPLAVPPEYLDKAAAMLDTLHQVERIVATHIDRTDPELAEAVETALQGIDPIEVRETQLILAAFAAINRDGSPRHLGAVA